MSTIKVKPWAKSQGDHVLINEADFNPELHQRLDGKGQPANTNPGQMKVHELRGLVERKGLTAPDNASKVDLLAILAKHEEQEKAEAEAKAKADAAAAATAAA